jgi:5-oxoprolinase (ATP-hydrolysing) subunit C
MTPAVVVERAGYAVVQDLGRPGFAGIGIAVNGALDQHAARTANILAGNAEDAPLIEITGSDLVLRVLADVLIAVTGAASLVLVDGHRQPSWETICVAAGSRVVIPYAAVGFRSYVAISGGLVAERVLDSVAPDPLLCVGTRLVDGDRLCVQTAPPDMPDGEFGTLFRMGAARTRLRTSATIAVTDGPDLTRLTLGRRALAAGWVVRPQSDHVGLRLDGPQITQIDAPEIASRGVPIGAVEVPPSGGIIVLLRGRLVTAGYPVVAVVTTLSLDMLAQVRPGDEVWMSFCDRDSAVQALRRQADGRAALARRVQRAFGGKGIAQAAVSRR